MNNTPHSQQQHENQLTPQYYRSNQPKITQEQYKQAIDRRYYGETISVIASDLGISTQALSKRFIKDKIIPAKARSYPVSKILDNIHRPITQDNINIHRNLTSKEIAKIMDKITLFSLKDASNKHIISIMLFNHLSNMFADIENNTIKNPQIKLDIMNLANRYLSTSPMNSSNEILKSINKYMTTLLKTDDVIANSFSSDPQAKDTLEKIIKLDNHIQELQQKQDDYY